MRAVFREATRRKFLGQTELLGFRAGGVDDSPLGVGRAFLAAESHFVKDRLAVRGDGDRLRGTQRGPIVEAEWMLLRGRWLWRFLGDGGNRREARNEKHGAENSQVLGWHKFIPFSWSSRRLRRAVDILAWPFKLFVTLFGNLIVEAVGGKDSTVLEAGRRGYDGDESKSSESRAHAEDRARTVHRDGLRRAVRRLSQLHSN